METYNDIMLLEYTVFGLVSFIIAEICHKSKLKIFFTLQNLDGAKNNIIKTAGKIGKKGSSGIILSFGNRTFNFHHSRFGWILAGISVISANISLLSVSLGLIIHHIIREKKIF